MAKFLGFFPSNPQKDTEETMKTPFCLARDLSDIGQSTPLVLPTTIRAATVPKRPTQKEELRHILLGSPGAIRQTIYLLHSLNYAEPALWSPIMPVGDRMIITPEQGESMSLLRRGL